MKKMLPRAAALSALLLPLTSPALADHHETAPSDEWAGFGAAGNEPFWSLRFEGDRMLFEHIGALESSAPRPEGGFTPGGAVFMSQSASGRDFIVLVEDEVCYDDMSGRPYPKAVRVFTEGQHFAGCGGDTRDLLTGVEWIVTAAGPYLSSQDDGVTIAFDAEGGFSGNGGCNRFHGSYELAEGISFGPVASTRRACADHEVMDRERMLFTQLGRVIAFEFGDHGELTLMAEDGAVIEAVRPH